MQANDCVAVFFDGVDPALLEPPINMMRLGQHPGGFASRLRNLEQVRAFLLPRPARQAMATGDPQPAALYEELRSYGAASGADSDPVDITFAGPVAPPRRGPDVLQHDHHLRRGLRPHTRRDRRRGVLSCR
ncbi:hypothetical protein ACWEKR_17660 [Nocardia sp. NPDC004573]